MNKSNDIKENKDIMALKNDLIKLFTEELLGLWRTMDMNFLNKLAYDIAKQKIEMESALTNEVRERCRTNLEHLKSTFQGNMVTRRIRLTWRGRKLFARVIKIIINSVIVIATNKFPKEFDLLRNSPSESPSGAGGDGGDGGEGTTGTS